MERRERANDAQESLRVTLEGWQSQLWTALPGILQSFDAAKITAVVQPAYKAKRRMPDGSVVDFDLPLLLDCPVVFPSGGGCTLTFPLKINDEVLVVLASRCIDAWWQQGGPQPALDMRMHDLSDGFVLPGVFSQPRVIPSISIAAAHFRSNSGETFVSIDPAGEVMTMTSPNEIVVNAPGIRVNGYVHSTDEIVAKIDADNIHVTTHIHSGVTPGGGSTAQPVDGT